MEPKKENVFECSAVTRWIEIEITNYCSMNCLVCPRKKIKKFEFLSFENFKKIVSLLKEWSYKEVMVCWLWDAFLHKELNDFMEYLFSEIPDINLFFMTKWQSINENHLEKILELKNKWFNVSITFSVFSLDEKIYNYLTWWNFYKTFIEVLNKVNKININYSMEFMLSALTLNELEKFKKFAKDLNKDYWISLVHNWAWEIDKKLHEKLFSEEKLAWYYIKRKDEDICEVMKYDYLYINSLWEVFQCSLNELERKWYLWILWEYNLKQFLDKKNGLIYKTLCEKCFYYNYKTFN